MRKGTGNYSSAGVNGGFLLLFCSTHVIPHKIFSILINPPPSLIGGGSFYDPTPTPPLPSTAKHQQERGWLQSDSCLAIVIDALNSVADLLSFIDSKRNVL